MSDIQNIKSQLNKIKIMIKNERQQDKQTIQKLLNQLNTINKQVQRVEKMSKKIKGGKLRAQKGGNLKI